MPLIKCPDCGKMVSDRVKNCPFCGCPAEFFEKKMQEVIVKRENNTESSTSEMEKKLSETENVQQFQTKIQENNKSMPSFSFAGRRITYPKGSEKFAALFGTYLKLADEGAETLLDSYYKSGGITAALSKVPDKAQYLLNEAIKKAVEYLYESGINFTEEQFVNKYYYKYKFNYNSYYDRVVEKYAEIRNQESQLKIYREAQKASRGRWQGGGFGFGGAIKGALMAGAMNMGTDFLHSFDDSAHQKNDTIEIRAKLKSLYEKESTKEALCNSIKTCIINIYNALKDELCEHKALPSVINLNYEEAIALYKNTISHETNEDIIRENLVLCIYKYPGEKKFYDALMKFIIIYDKCELVEFMEFWNIEYLCPDFRKGYKEGHDWDLCFIEQTKDKFAFNNLLVDQYLILHKVLYDYVGEPGVIPDFKYSFIIPRIKEYLLKFNKENHTALGTYAIFGWIPIECSPSEFISYVRSERTFLPAALLDRYWLYGDSETKAGAPNQRVRNRLMEVGDKLLLYYDSSWMEDGTKGLALTEKYIINLKDAYKIDIRNVKDIQHYNDNSIRIYDKEHCIIFKEEPFTEDALFYLLILLHIFCAKYGDNTELWCEKMSIPNPSLVPAINYVAPEEQKNNFQDILCGDSVEDLPRAFNQIVGNETLQCSEKRKLLYEIAVKGELITSDLHIHEKCIKREVALAFLLQMCYEEFIQDYNLRFNELIDSPSLAINNLKDEVKILLNKYSLLDNIEWDTVNKELICTCMNNKVQFFNDILYDINEMCNYFTPTVYIDGGQEYIKSIVFAQITTVSLDKKFKINMQNDNKFGRESALVKKINMPNEYMIYAIYENRDIFGVCGTIISENGLYYRCGINEFLSWEELLLCEQKDVSGSILKLSYSKKTLDIWAGENSYNFYCSMKSIAEEVVKYQNMYKGKELKLLDTVMDNGALLHKRFSLGLDKLNDSKLFINPNSKEIIYFTKTLNKNMQTLFYDNRPNLELLYVKNIKLSGEIYDFEEFRGFFMTRRYLFVKTITEFNALPLNKIIKIEGNNNKIIFYGSNGVRLKVTIGNNQANIYADQFSQALLYKRGESLNRCCSNCGSKLKGNERFCGKCGAKVEMEERGK